MLRRGGARGGTGGVLRGRGRCQRGYEESVTVFKWFSRMEEERVPKEAAHDVLEQAYGLLLDELVDHVRKHCADGVESLVGLADVRKTNIVKQDLLHNEDGNRL